MDLMRNFLHRLMYLTVRLQLAVLSGRFQNPSGVQLSWRKYMAAGGL